MRIDFDREKFNCLLDLIDNWYEEAEMYANEGWVEEDEDRLLPKEQEPFVKKIANYFKEHGWDMTAAWFVENDLEIFVAYAEVNFEAQFASPTEQLELPM